ncbi:MAG: hypothetical protein ACRC6D_04260, partial [Aeromonas sp.]
MSHTITPAISPHIYHAIHHPNYNYTVVRQFTVMTIVWGIVGMSVGLLLAAQLIWPALNFDTPWL